MVTIPQKDCPTIEAIKKAIYQKQFDEKQRDYLGASLIGNECVRQVWYDYNGFEKEPFEADTLLKFDDGHRTEDLTAERLRLVDGIELWTHDENGNQFGFSDIGGKFKGHIDGVIRGLLQAPKALHIWESKACEPKKFKEFRNCLEKYGEKAALENWNKNYYVQAQLYMHYFQIDRHYTTVAAAGGRNYLACRTEYNPAVAEMYRDRARYIIGASEAPDRLRNASKDYYLCKWCSFSEICHG